MVSKEEWMSLEITGENIGLVFYIEHIHLGLAKIIL